MLAAPIANKPRTKSFGLASQRYVFEAKAFGKCCSASLAADIGHAQGCLVHLRAKQVELGTLCDVFATGSCCNAMASIKRSGYAFID